jgi:hypothetical protein
MKNNRKSPPTTDTPPIWTDSPPLYAQGAVYYGCQIPGPPWNPAHASTWEPPAPPPMDQTLRSLVVEALLAVVRREKGAVGLARVALKMLGEYKGETK